MGWHTTLNVDRQLLAEAQEALGTKTMSATVNEALREVVLLRRRRRLRRRLLTYELPELTPEAVEEARAPRSFGGSNT
jgi:Arc/MetJ family transcription regulator